ncbi:hypothetical protein GZ212_12905 [Mangrovimonas sp. CR14]|uniref:parallel beta-helix domain-containing protein n=1 Tax=Mangrovimonas sp. CR14 TaxID=2706120 RepID=UPI0014220CBE|nr:parallel beta-helix domain-containing protein [Mangrovimonas sp. CR14]NIK93056.1 hypothetical protein [Mangrovimonas sp. CR14]
MYQTIKKLFSTVSKVMCFTLIITSCSNDDDNNDNFPTSPSNVITISPGANAQNEALDAFIEVESGQTILFEAGTFNFTGSLSMTGKNEIIIKGSGRDQTYLDFSAQTSGGEGILVENSTSIRFENLTIKDAVGDALKTRECTKVSFVNVATVWSGEPSSNNGAYGLYPVLCDDVYIDNCYAYGASDSGIYVGQSNNVIVKNTVAEGNVGGIEIENTTNADVFYNDVFDNTGGILVFDLPGLTQSGSGTRVFDNNIHDNNRSNFAPEGNIIGNVPAGTGIMVLSTKNVEIFYNSLVDNNFTNILVASYLMVNPNPQDPTFNPFPQGLNIHENSYTMSGTVNPNQPALAQALMQLFQLTGYPNILLDGILMQPTDVCLQEATDPSFINLNAAADPTFESFTMDTSPHDCSPDPLPQVEFDEF